MEKNHDVISGAEATLRDEETSDKGERSVREGKFLLSLSFSSGYTWIVPERARGDCARAFYWL